MRYCTRPDIAYAVLVLSKYNDEGKHHTNHWEAAKRVVRYLKGTPWHGVTPRGTTPLELQSSMDASWGDDLAKRRSTLAYCTTPGAGPMSWKSGRSSTVEQSTVEAEYYAVCLCREGVKKVVHLRQLLASIGLPLEGPTTVQSDSHAALAMSKSPEFHARTKHIDIRHHSILEKVKDSTIQGEYIHTEKNPADAFTKALEREKHQPMVSLLHLQEHSRVDKGLTRQTP